MICAIEDEKRFAELCWDVGVTKEKTLVRVDGLGLGLAREALQTSPEDIVVT